MPIDNDPLGILGRQFDTAAGGRVASPTVEMLADHLARHRSAITAKLVIQTGRSLGLKPDAALTAYRVAVDVGLLPDIRH